MKFKTFLLGVTAAAMMSGAALAANPSVKAGAQVFDATGGSVGTIESVNGDLAVVSTGSNKVSLPLSSFGQGDKGPVIGMTKAQLDSAATGAKAEAQAQTQASLTPGTQVYGSNGQVVGTVDSVDSQFVTLAVEGQKAKLPLNAVGKGEKGPVIAMTADDLKAAVKASAPQAAPASGTPN